MNPTKTERDQWRERLLSPYTCFNTEHAIFTIRLLDALEEADTEKERLEQEAVFWREETKDVRELFTRQLGYKDAEIARLEREADWLATKLNEIASPCRTLHPCEGSPSCNYPDGEPRCWRDVAHKAVEEGEESCPKN